MDISKKAAFVKAMGKGRKKFYRGGPVRKNFVGGGLVNTNAVNPNTGILGSVGGALGLNDNFQAGSANINPGTTTGQLNSAYNTTTAALENQDALANNLTGQVPGAVNNQNALAAQELAMSQGAGPNPAMAQLAQTTGTNVASQAALQAGQRGASGNVGLMARQIGQQGAATQQEAVGQGATLEAQQQIAAQQNLANLSGTQINQTGQAVTGQNSAQQNEQNILQNANTSANNAAVSMQSNINNVNSQTAAANQNMAGNILGGLTGGLSGGLGAIGLAKGGMVEEKEHHLKLAEMNAQSLMHGKKYFDDGGEVSTNLGTFHGDSSAPSSGPSIPSTSSLPPSQGLGGSGGGGKSGGGGGLLALLNKGGDVQRMAGGGMPIGPNPLLTNSGPLAANLGAGSYVASSASSGPGIPGTSSLPQDQTDLSKSYKSKPKDTSHPDVPSEGEVVDGGYAGDDIPATNDISTYFAARGGMMGAPCEGPHNSHVVNYLKGGKVPAMVSPGEIYLSPDKVQEVMKTGEDPKKVGEKFKGKAKVKGDSLKNDFIPRDLDEGGVVIDRKNVGTKEKRAAFVRKTVAKKKAGRK